MVLNLIYFTLLIAQIIYINCHPQGTILLGYKPMRPSYHPNPGNNIEVIIPPGEPWPARPEDYDKFSQTTKPAWYIRTSTRTQQTFSTTPSLVPSSTSIPTSSILNNILISINSTTEQSNVPTYNATSIVDTTTQRIETNSINTVEEGQRTKPTLYTSKPVLPTNDDDLVNITIVDDTSRIVSDLLTSRFQNNKTLIRNDTTSTTTSSLITTTAKTTVTVTTDETDRLLQPDMNNLASFIGNNPEPSFIKPPELNNNNNNTINNDNNKDKSKVDKNDSSEEEDDDDCKEDESNDKQKKNNSDSSEESTKLITNNSKESSFEIVRAVEIINPRYDNIKPYLAKFVNDNV